MKKTSKEKLKDMFLGIPRPATANRHCHCDIGWGCGKDMQIGDPILVVGCYKKGTSGQVERDGGFVFCSEDCAKNGEFKFQVHQESFQQ